jgi:lactate permease
MGGFRALRGVLPAAIVCGVSFAATQFLVSNYLGPQLTDILSSLAAIASLVLLLKAWRPRDRFVLNGDTAQHTPATRSSADVRLAWSAYAVLVLLVLLWGLDPVKAQLNRASLAFAWPGLHEAVQIAPPVSSSPSPYAARYTLSTLSASGTACLFAAVISSFILRVRPTRFAGIVAATARQLSFSILTIASVLGLAFLMNYSGATATMGLAFAATGPLFPFFSALLGWLGVFLTGSDTSANALFGNLQVVTANSLNMNATLMAASNSSGGVMGKMISLQSIAVAAAATGMQREDESRLFRFTLRHSILLASVLGLVVVVYAYLLPEWVR